MGKLLIKKGFLVVFGNGSEVGIVDVNIYTEKSAKYLGDQILEVGRKGGTCNNDVHQEVTLLQCEITKEDMLLPSVVGNFVSSDNIFWTHSVK
jgi:hypothetical protein